MVGWCEELSGRRRVERFFGSSMSFFNVMPSWVRKAMIFPFMCVFLQSCEMMTISAGRIWGAMESPAMRNTIYGGG